MAFASLNYTFERGGTFYNFEKLAIYANKSEKLKTQT